MSATIDPKLLEALKDAMLANPEMNDEEILDVIGETSDIEAYNAALIEKYPDDFGDAPEVVAAPAKPATKQAKNAPAKKQAQAAPAAKTEAPKAAPAAKSHDAETFVMKVRDSAGTPLEKKLSLRHEDGTVTRLRVFRETGSAVLFEVEPPEPVDNVTIVVSGRNIVVDLNELRRMPGNSELHGKPVASLILLAEAAK